MIVHFGCKDTQAIWDGTRTKRWSTDIVNRGLRKLFLIHSAEDIRDLMVPPSNRLHKLKGDLRDYYSISVNEQWRLIFKWNDGIATDVQLVDYH